MPYSDVLDGMIRDMTRTINRHVRDHKATPADIIAACELVKAAAIAQMRATELPEPPQTGGR